MTRWHGAKLSAMTNRKITAFWMHPTSAAAPLGGPPPEAGVADGCIQKDAGEWQSIHSLALDLVERLRIERALTLQDKP